MADANQVRDIIVKLLKCYPHEAGRLGADIVDGMMEVWPEFLDDIPDDVLAEAVKDHIAQSQWFPNIAQIRAAARRVEEGDDTYEGLMRRYVPDHLKDIIKH